MLPFSEDAQKRIGLEIIDVDAALRPYDSRMSKVSEIKKNHKEKEGKGDSRNMSLLPGEGFPIRKRWSDSDFCLFPPFCYF